MAQQILANESQNAQRTWLVDRILVEDVVSDVLAEQCPELEDCPGTLEFRIADTTRQLLPALNALARAYLRACKTPAGGETARRFLENMLSAAEA